MSQVLEVVSPGMLATVQDLGRRGHQGEGVPVCGAMDPFALEVGNILLGNDRGAAALEIALRGPTFRVLRDLDLCICGGDMGAVLSGAPLPSWQAVRATAGAELSFTGQKHGAWAYLCVAGGIDVPLVMGSRSTYLRAALGGLRGRTLRVGDVLQAGVPGPRVAARALRPADIPSLGSQAAVRAVPGPQEGMFEPGSVERFYEDAFAVTARSDRMGYRLQGRALRHSGGADILSDGTALGSVQVPADGQPIVLMADRQTTGGYPKIATVISVDVPVLAQLPAGASVIFRRVTVEAAQDALTQRRVFLDALANGMRG